jgi:flagellar protein FlaJ
MLAHDFKQLELQRLKKQAQKIPSKIRVLSFVMLLCFLLTYLAIIAVQVVQSLSGMF